ncbi:hypothetical protein HC823_00485, partial [Candidatus Gracilibacteria bacterium]|nr:hypothetical protein [Candidatus Gracilibacteria bacterium]
NSALEIIAQKAEGGLRDAISLLEQIAAETERSISDEAVRQSLGLAAPELLENFYQAIAENNPTQGLEILKNISKGGGDFRSFAKDFLNFLREKLYQALFAGENVNTLVASVEEMQTAISRLKSSPIVELPLEIALIKLCQMGNGIAPVSSPKPAALKPSPPSAPVQKSVTPEPPRPEPKPAPIQEAPKPTPTPKANSATNGFEFGGVASASTSPKTQSERPPSVPADAGIGFIAQKMDEIAIKAGLPVFVKNHSLRHIRV